MKRDCIVYMHIAPGNHIYIGQTNQKFELRCGRLGEGYKGCTYFWNVIQKYGWENVKHEVLYENLTRAEANAIETALIDTYKKMPEWNVCNIFPGGGAHMGPRFNKDIKAEMSERMRGRIKINNGVSDKMIHPEELDKYIECGWKKGTYRKWNEEERKAISKRLTGVKHPESRRINNAKAQKKFIWVTDGISNKRIKKSEYDNYFSQGWKRGQTNLSIVDKVWMNNGDTHLLVESNDIDKYAKMGFIKGMLNGGNGGANKGKVRVHKGNCRKYIPVTELQNYLDKGYVRGW